MPVYNAFHFHVMHAHHVKKGTCKGICMDCPLNRKRCYSSNLTQGRRDTIASFFTFTDCLNEDVASQKSLGGRENSSDLFGLHLKDHKTYFIHAHAFSYHIMESHYSMGG